MIQILTNQKKLLTQRIGLVIIIIILLLASACNSQRSYSQVVNSYPSGTELCETEVSVENTATGGLKISGTVAFQGAFGAAPVDAEENLRCFGAKVTVVKPVTLDGETYEAGTLLTVDRRRRWIEVSSFD